MKKWIILFLVIVVIGLTLYFSFVRETDCQLTTPDLVGLDIKEAERLLAYRNMKIIITDTTLVAGAKNGQIISQLPFRGTINCDSVTVKISVLK